jgi:aminoglycoside phosphotransferase (APT) family kinase protein
MTAKAARALLRPEAAPSPERLVAAVRRGLRLSDTVPVSLREEGELANINYVYRVELPDRSLYLKVVRERPKRFPVRLPEERLFSEAEALRRFRRLASREIVIPEVFFLDVQEMALGMSDVGESRQVLFGVISDRFELLTEQAAVLGRTLGRIHRATRGGGTLRPVQEEAIIRKVVFEGLLAPGAKQAFPETWDAVNAEMQGHTECLIHADLWSKNLLVRCGEPVAVVDFEGVCYGDPAFDLGTLSAVALLPALDKPALLIDALSFIGRLMQSWASACGSDDWYYEVLPRAFRATATFLATRGFGPFAYSLSDEARRRLVQVARPLAAEPPADLEGFQALVVRHSN